MGDMEDAWTGEVGRPPVSPEAHDGGRAPGTLHHVIVRGIENRRIVDDRKDRESFLERLANLLPETQMACYGWVFIANPDDIFSKRKQPKKVKVRGLLCFWAVQELGISLTELARHLGISVPPVGYAVERAEATARDKNYQLIYSRY